MSDPRLTENTPITLTCHQLSTITMGLCECGGRGPDENPCDACAIYHKIMSAAGWPTVKQETP